VDPSLSHPSRWSRKIACVKLQSPDGRTNICPPTGHYSHIYSQFRIRRNSKNGCNVNINDAVCSKEIT